MSENEGKQKKKGLWWKVLLGLFALMIVGSMLGGDDEPASDSTNAGAQEVAQTETTKATAKTVAEKKYGVGDAITVGEVKWVVGTPEKKDIIKSGNEYTDPAKPNGIFIVIPLTAELIGKESGTIDDSQLKIVDAKGRSFNATSDFNVSVLLGDTNIFLKQVNPNVPVKGTAVFDIATDATGLRLEISDLKMFSGAKPGYVELGL